MFEKVSPSHPDKIADRIASALVDLAYRVEANPRCSFEVLIGHGECSIFGESSVRITHHDARGIVERLAGDMKVRLNIRGQDMHLAENQIGAIRCGDNGIFKGCVPNMEERLGSELMRFIYSRFPYDGKLVIDKDLRIVTVCQSRANRDAIVGLIYSFLEKNKLDYTEWEIKVNPLGDWTGGPAVDSGATNRKLGSDMGQATTGGGPWGKDLSKPDITLNLIAYLQAEGTAGPARSMMCSIGDESIDGRPYSEYAKKAREWIFAHGGFEKVSEWGLI